MTKPKHVKKPVKKHNVAPGVEFIVYDPDQIIHEYELMSAEHLAEQRYLNALRDQVFYRRVNSWLCGIGLFVILVWLELVFFWSLS